MQKKGRFKYASCPELPIPALVVESPEVTDVLTEAEAMRFLFVHGGPGMNNFAEQAILGPLLSARGLGARFWNEPSRLRPSGDPFDSVAAFSGWVASLERALLALSDTAPVVVQAHCFASGPAIDVARRHPGRVAALVLTGPSPDPYVGLLRVLRLAQADLADDLPEVASKLGECLTRTRSLMDSAMQDAVGLALNDQKLFTHYWADRAQFEKSVAAMAVPEAQFDAESFFAVATDFAQQWPRRIEKPLTTPTLIVCGGRDPITPYTETVRGVLDEIPDATVEIFEDAGHFVHLDRPEQFVDTMIGWAGRAVATASV